MRNRLVSIMVPLVAVLCLTIPAFGTIVFDPDLTLDGSVGSDAGLKLINFYDVSGNLNTSERFAADHVMSLKDAPYTKDSSGNIVAWKITSGDGCVNEGGAAVTYLNQHIDLSQLGGDSIHLQAEIVGSANKVSLLGTYWDEIKSNSSLKQNPNVNRNPENYSGKEISNGSDDYLNLGLENDLSLENCFWLQANSTRFVVKLDTGKSNPDDLPSVTNIFTNSEGKNTSDYLDDYLVAARGYLGTKWDIGGGISYVRTKSSIGLETSDADYSEGNESQYNHYYKPVNLSNLSNGKSPFDEKRSLWVDSSNRKSGVANTYVSEYCAHRITLESDLVLTGDLTLGGLTGFVKSDSDSRSTNWTQTNYQNLMIGAYAEIDLNGYDLIVEDGHMIDSFGSITDSSSRRTGTVVLRQNARLYTPLVFENGYREDTFPESYFSGTDYLTMMRCPYLDCTLVMEKNSKFWGKFWTSFGNNGTFHCDFNLVGPDSSFIFQWNSNSDSGGTITRQTYYNEELYQKIKDSKGNMSLYNISYQRFKYIFQNVNLNVNPLAFHFKLETSIGNKEFDFNSKKFQMTVAPYFDFYAYGSDLFISTEFNFMCGCYLYGDSDSTITFGWGEFNTGSCDLSAGKNKWNYHSGGFNLSSTYYDFEDGKPAKSGWYDDRKTWNSGNQSFGDYVWLWDDFWNYYKEKPAQMDFYGEFKFNDNNPIPYSLGGIINLADNDKFIDSVRDRVSNKKINLYSSSVIVAITMSYFGLNLGGIVSARRTFSVSGLYNSPFVSNGEVLTPIDGKYLLSAASYLLNERLILDDDGNYYAFMFLDDGPSNHVYWANHDSLTSDPNDNSLNGQWKRITRFEDNDLSGYPYIQCDSSYYISYHGAWLPYNPNSQSVSLMKLVGMYGMADKDNSLLGRDDYDTTDRDVYRTLKYDTSKKTIAISGKVDSL